MNTVEKNIKELGLLLKFIKAYGYDAEDIGLGDAIRLKRLVKDLFDTNLKVK